jgi:hypothetical protein
MNLQQQQLEKDSDRVWNSTDSRGTATRSSYGTLLDFPLSSLVSNVPDRPDVMTTAILGYN